MRQGVKLFSQSTQEASGLRPCLPEEQDRRSFFLAKVVNCLCITRRKSLPTSSPMRSIAPSKVKTTARLTKFSPQP